MVELQPAGLLGQHDRVVLLLDERRKVEHLEDPLEADQRRHDVDAHVGKALQRAEQAEEQGGEREQGADAHGVGVAAYAHGGAALLEGSGGLGDRCGRLRRQHRLAGVEVHGVGLW